MMEQTTVQVTPVSVMPRETAATPVTLRTAQSVRGLQFRIRHDTACLHQASFIKNEDLHGISAVFSTHDGLTTVVLFSEDGTWLPAGVHLLGRLRFSVTDDAVAGSTLPLIVEQVTIADKLRDDAPASGIHSAILIGIEHLTDQGGRHLIRLSHLIRILNERAGASTPGTPAFDALDTNGDSVLDIADIVLLSQRLKERDALPSLEEFAPVRITFSMILSGDRTLPSIALQIESEQQIAGIQVLLVGKPDQLQCGGPHTVGRSECMNLDYGEEHGELRLIIYSPLGRDVRPGSGAVMMMPILRQDEVYRLQASVQSCILSPVSLIQGWVGYVRI
jgi:hypothetical protein